MGLFRDDELHEKVDRILYILMGVRRKEVHMGSEMDSLKLQMDTLVTDVAEMKTVSEGAAAAITSMVAKNGQLLEELNAAIATNNTAEIQAAAEKLAMQNQLLSEAKQRLVDAIAAVPA